MKKHILGFAIFSFIFASFAVAFAYFYAPPIPQISEVKTSVYQSDSRNTCRKKRSTATNIKYEVISSEYFYNQNIIVSRIKLTWNGYGNAPEKISVIPQFASNGDSHKRKGNSQFFNRPFTDSGIITVIGDFSEDSDSVSAKYNKKFDRKKNLYAYFTIFDENSETNNPATFISTNPAPVVFVHNGYFGYGSGSGESSEVRKGQLVVSE